MLRSFAVGYERFCRIVLMIAVTHVAFLVHTLMGVVVIGLFPSISATYTTYRTWWLDEDHSWSIRQTWTVFHRAWKDELVLPRAVEDSPGLADAPAVVFVKPPGAVCRVGR